MRNTATSFLTVLITSLLITTLSLGQSRFSFAPTFSPSYQSLNWTSQVDNRDEAKGSLSTTGFSAGLTAFYRFTPNWSLSAGFLYNRSSGENSYDNYRDVATLERRNENWQLPLLLNFTSSTHRLSPYFSVGLLANHNYHSTIDNIYSAYHKIDEGTVFTFSVYGMIGAGMNFRITPKLGLIIQPTAAYRLNAPSIGNPISYIHWNEYLYGLQTQLKFTL